MAKVPLGWKRCKLGDFVSLRNGYAFKSEDFGTEGIPVVRISDIQDGLVTPNEAVKVPEVKAKAGFYLERGDVLVAMSGATTGKIGRYTSDRPALQNQRVGNLIPRNPHVSKDFIYYWIQIHKKDIEEQAYGGAQPNISSKLIEQIETRLPPLPEQKRIVAKLDTLFAHLDLLRARLDKIPVLLKQFRQAVLTQAVTGKLIRSDAFGFEAVSLEQLISESLLGLDRNANAQDLNKPFKYVKMNNISLDGRMVLDNVVRVDASKEDRIRYSLKEGDLLFNTRNSYELVGKAAIFDTLEKEVLFNNNLLRLRFKSNALPTFVWVCLNSPAGKRYLDSIKSSTTNVAAIYYKNLKQFPLLLPPLAVQERIVNRVESLLTIADRIEVSSKQLSDKIGNLPQAILARAFQGQLALHEGIKL